MNSIFRRAEQRLVAVQSFFTKDEAIAITEYGMLIALVGIALIGVVAIFGPQISTWFATKTGNVTTV